MRYGTMARIVKWTILIIAIVLVAYPALNSLISDKGNVSIEVGVDAEYDLSYMSEESLYSNLNRVVTDVQLCVVKYGSEEMKVTKDNCRSAANTIFEKYKSQSAWSKVTVKDGKGDVISQSSIVMYDNIQTTNVTGFKMNGTVFKDLNPSFNVYYGDIKGNYLIKMDAKFEFDKDGGIISMTVPNVLYVVSLAVGNDMLMEIDLGYLGLFQTSAKIVTKATTSYDVQFSKDGAKDIITTGIVPGNSSGTVGPVSFTFVDGKSFILDATGTGYASVSDALSKELESKGSLTIKCDGDEYEMKQDASMKFIEVLKHLEGGKSA